MTSFNNNVAVLLLDHCLTSVNILQVVKSNSSDIIQSIIKLPASDAIKTQSLNIPTQLTQIEFK